ncbi:MAG TPA: PilX N-terminal domain-containing pilus assembly protein [Candidatus Polarisedimenticolia bacterium]|nr:PilX N-terminal domain-containing pilus assembly protein [Candidatus Polarisedimenticolia bacterium]
MNAQTRHSMLTPNPARRGEEGSALILAALVTVILSLLGLSYLMMAQTENTIAENERNSAAALYVAEAGTRLVIGWFNDPSATGYLVPTLGDLDRTKRIFDHDNNGGTARVQGASADAAKPLYKDATQTLSLIFDRPYRGVLADTLLGIETGTDPNVAFAAMGPDLIVNASFLTTINDTLFPNFPTPFLRARITRIEVYAPPILSIGGSDTRMGVATVKVTAGVFQYPGTASERQIATRIVKAVINEIPVPGPVGPLQSCSGLAYNGDFKIHWGTGTSVGNADIPVAGQLDSKMLSGLPYALNDPFTYINGATTLVSWATAHTNEQVEDPWFKYIAGGTIDSAGNTNPQPWPWPSSPDLDKEHSNLFQNTTVNCPTFDYALWKSIAQSGLKNNYYYKWVSGTNYSLDGTGTSTDYRVLTNGKAGIFFFDTQDTLAPNVAGTNLTPAISLSGSGYGVSGFVYVNAANYATTGLGGLMTTYFPPGEPSDASGFVNFDYPGSTADNYVIKQTTGNFETFQDPVTNIWYCTDAATCTSASRTPAGAPVQDLTGLPFQTDAVLNGVLYNSGTFETQGNAKYFGSVVGQRGVIDGGGTPEFWFDERLIKGEWPPKGMSIPRVVVSAWQTDL